jgi:hypothetical protein
MIGKQQITVSALALATIILLHGLSFATSLDKIQFIKISPNDAKAVIKAADGKLQVIKPGDAIGESVTVKEIAPRRIVLEEMTGTGAETIIVRLENGKSSMERLRKVPEGRTMLMVPGGSYN